MALPPLNTQLSWKSSDPAVVALLDDLQANILKGHGRRHSIHLFLSFDPAKAAVIKGAIHQLSGGIKTARQQLAETEAFRATGADGGVVRCFMLSFAGYQVLGVLPKAPVSAAFAGGMKSRGGFLKDPPVASWDNTFKQNIHAMLLLADGDPDALKSERDSVVATLNALGVTVVGEEVGNQQFNSRGDGVEHFGYVDGRSQPLFLTEDVQNETLLEGGTSMWDPAFPLDQVLVTTPPGPAQVVLGSFFVFRKLEQNVLGFKRKEEEVALAMGLHGAEAELAGAMMVGRFEDGTPVVVRKAPIEGVVRNNFNYADDTAGVKCPFHGHIRKTNPRGSGGQETPPVERRHIMARRGITYGEREAGMCDRPEKDVGLLFMAFQSSLENQFEFTQQTWANNPGFPTVPPGNAPPGIDPVMGQGINPPGTQQMPLHWGDPATAKVPQNFANFVTLKGGEYFFAPTLSTLRTL